MTIKYLAKNKVGLKYFRPGDIVVVRYHDAFGNTEIVCSEEMTQYGEVDTAAVFEFRDEFGLEYGVGGIFGKSKS